MAKKPRRAKMGRPLMNPAKRKGATVIVRMTRAERLRLERAAKAAGKALSEFVRDALLRTSDKALEG